MYFYIKPKEFLPQRIYYPKVCIDNNMIQGLLMINWFRLVVKEGDHIPNIKICCEFDVDRMLKEIMKLWFGIQPDKLLKSEK
jgi:hypothetical protein